MKNKYKLVKRSYLNSLITMIVILPLISGYICYMAGQVVEYNRAEDIRIVFNKEVKHKEYFHRYIMGELNNWDKQQVLKGKKTARLNHD